MDVLQDADTSLLVTEWPEYCNLKWVEIKSTVANSLIVDGCNCSTARKWNGWEGGIWGWGDSQRSQGYCWSSLLLPKPETDK